MIVRLVGSEMCIRDRLETLSKKDHESEMKMHVSIGAGVTLTCQHPGGGEGTTIVDLGSGIFGERTWSDAASLTRDRMEELGTLLESLQSQSQQLESTIAKLAQTFTAAAEAQTQPEPSMPVNETESPSEAAETSVSKPKRRRGGMFGNELTLDD